MEAAEKPVRVKQRAETLARTSEEHSDEGRITPKQLDPRLRTRKTKRLALALHIDELLRTGTHPSITEVPAE